MARNELGTITKAVDSLKKNIKKGNQQLPAWVQSKITKATDYIDTAADYLGSEEDSVDEACWNGYKQVGMKKKKRKWFQIVFQKKQKFKRHQSLVMIT